MIQRNNNFWDFSVLVQSKNSLLRNTTSHLKEEQVRHCLELGMNQRLALRCRLEKSSKVADFREWITEVKHVDDLLKSEKLDFKALAKTTHKQTRCFSTFAELSRHINVNNQQSTGPSNNCVNLPKLLDSE